MMAEVLALHATWDEGNTAAFIGPDDPAVLHDALLAYRVFVLATRGEQDKRRRARTKNRHK